MIWKLLGLQKKLDALFCDEWVILGQSTPQRILPPAQLLG